MRSRAPFATCELTSGGARKFQRPQRQIDCDIEVE